MKGVNHNCVTPPLQSNLSIRDRQRWRCHTPARSLHEVPDIRDGQIPFAFSVEHFRRLDRFALESRIPRSGRCLIKGNIPRAAPTDLYSKRSMRKGRKPQPAEIDHDRGRFVERCWTQHLPPWQVQGGALRYGSGLIWLAMMPGRHLSQRDRIRREFRIVSRCAADRGPARGDSGRSARPQWLNAVEREPPRSKLKP